MPRKGMRSLWFSTTPPSSFSASHSPSPSRRLSDAAMERSIAAAETMIMKWNPEASTFAKVTSVFYENSGEARDFINSVAELQKAMHFLVKEDPQSEKLVRSQKLMEIAMKRLQKEFYQILSMNRAYLDPESVSARSSLTSTTRSSMSEYDDDDGSEEEIRIAGESVTEVEQVSATVMADLRLIAETMISTGYGKECVKIYKTMRKSIVDEGIYRLGVERVSNSKIHKMDWELIELKTKNWLSAVKIAVKTLFNGERILCDHVFAASDTIRESCFAEITKEGAQILFGLPELAVRNKKNSPEKVFRMLDMYTAISENWPEIESIFSFESTSAVLSQAITALAKLGESVRTMVADYESAIQKDKSKSRVPGGGVHHLTVEVMNYLSLLGDYSNILPDILAYSPLPEKSSLPESYFDSSDPDGSPKQAISLRFAWLILVLLCKLDGKAAHYKDVSLAYLFFANNLQHVVDKVRKSNIKYLLGDDWISKQEAKVKQFASSYERLAWGSVVESLTQDPTAEMSAEEVKECLRRFNRALEKAYLKQSGCVVDDSNLRQQIKLSITRKVEAAYREFYHTQRVEAWRGDRHLVRFAPEDVRNYLSDLFFGTVESGSSSLPSRSRSP